MTDYYPYLIASLPGLSLGAAPPISSERLIALCARLIPDSDLELLHITQTPRAAVEYRGNNRMLTAWRRHESALRNEIARIRADRKKRDPGMYLRPADGFEDPALGHAALHAHRAHSPIEGERMLDELRWAAAEALASGHFFDLDALLAYGLKLGILIRWETIRAADGAGLLAGVVAAQ